MQAVIQGFMALCSPSRKQATHVRTQVEFNVRFDLWCAFSFLLAASSSDLFFDNSNVSAFASNRLMSVFLSSIKFSSSPLIPKIPNPNVSTTFLMRSYLHIVSNSVPVLHRRLSMFWKYNKIKGSSDVCRKKAIDSLCILTHIWSFWAIVFLF